MDFKVIITAGGNSSRFFGGNDSTLPGINKSMPKVTNKLLEKVHSKEVIRHTVDAFLAVNNISEIIICANKSIISTLNDIFKAMEKIRIIEGGGTRQQSVFNGLLALNNCDYVLIHDGARPIITPKIIKKTIVMVQNKKALTVATKTTDTIKQVDENLKITRTLDRSFLYNTQTPQAFEYNLIKEAHEKLQGKNFTDDASMLEFLGLDVYILECDYKNIKITTQNDIDIAQIYLAKK